MTHELPQVIATRGRVTTVALICLSIAACRTSGSTEKGGLVAVRADPAAVEGAFAPRRFALLVGIGEQRDDAWRPLRFATKDAHDLAFALADPRRGGFGDVSVLDDAAHTTRDGILAAVRELARRA